jgi:hypothetical protein
MTFSFGVDWPGLGKIEIIPDHGYRVKETETHYIDVVPMLFNHRLVTTRKDNPLLYDRGWCYQGAGLEGFTAAVTAALAWDGSDDTEPEGWIKNPITGERREPPSPT